VYSLQLSRYIHLNPVKAKMVDSPEAWRWSSYGAFVGKRKEEIFLETGWLLKQIGSRVEFERFTLDGLTDAWDPEASGKGPVLGPEEFVERIKARFVPEKKDSSLTGLRELRREDRLKDVEKCVKGLGCDEGLRKKLLLYGLRRYTGLSLKEAGERVGGMEPIAVSQTVRRLCQEAERNKEIHSLMQSLDCKM